MNPSRPTMSREEAKQFTRDFSQLNARLIGKLTLAKTKEEAKEALYAGKPRQLRPPSSKDIVWDDVSDEW